MPLAVEVVGKRASADRAEAVEFGDGFNFNRYAHKISWQSSVGSRQRIAGLNARALFFVLC